MPVQIVPAFPGKNTDSWLTIISRREESHA